MPRRAAVLSPHKVGFSAAAIKANMHLSGGLRPTRQRIIRQRIIRQGTCAATMAAA